MPLFKFETTRKPSKDTFISSPITGRPMTPPPRMGLLGIICAFALCLLVLYWVRQSGGKSMSKQTLAIITDSALYKDHRVNLYYIFYTSNHTYTFSKVYNNLDPKEAAVLMNKKIPLIYNSKDPEIHLLLLNQKDYKDAERIQPDSLKPLNKLFE